MRHADGLPLSPQAEARRHRAAPPQPPTRQPLRPKRRGGCWRCSQHYPMPPDHPAAGPIGPMPWPPSLSVRSERRHFRIKTMIAVDNTVPSPTVKCRQAVVAMLALSAVSCAAGPSALNEQFARRGYAGVHAAAQLRGRSGLRRRCASTCCHWRGRHGADSNAVNLGAAGAALHPVTTCMSCAA